MIAKLAALQRNTREPNNENPKVTTAEHRISVGLIVREGTPRKADRFSRLQGSRAHAGHARDQQTHTLVTSGHVIQRQARRQADTLVYPQAHTETRSSQYLAPLQEAEQLEMRHAKRLRKVFFLTTLHVY